MIEVLRVIRYRYADGTKMAQDMARWTMRFKGHDMEMDSTVVVPVYHDDIEEGK